MTAPARSPAPARDAAPARSAAPRPRSGSGRARSAAARRAYARRAQRTDRWLALGAEPEAAGGRIRFVVLVMVLLTTGLVATLWLSTAAAAGSYRMQEAQTETRDLSELSEQLSRRVATLETAPQLARRARELGMVPAGEPAHLVVGADGTVTVVGEPTPATAPPPPPPATPVPSPAAPAPIPEPAPEPAPEAEPAPDAEPAPEPERRALPAPTPPGDR